MLAPLVGDVVLAIAPWILHEGSARIDATTELEMSQGKVGKPVSLAPDAWYGATDGLTIGVVDSKYAMTGFRGSAGGAFCVTGPNDGCSTLYNDVGLEAWQAIARGPEALVIGAGGYATNIQKGFYAAKLGIKARVAEGRLSLATQPSVFVAVTDRNLAMSPNLDQLYLPVALALKLSTAASFTVGSGIKGQVRDFTHHWAIPIGASLALTIGHVQLGAAWTFGSLDVADQTAQHGVDQRVLQAWLSYTMFGTPRRHASPPAHVEVAVKPVVKPVTGDPLLEPAKPERAPAFPGTAMIADDVIAHQANEHAKELASCEGGYELHGEVTIGFLVDEKGAVKKTTVASTVGNIVVSDCVLAEVRSWKFPEGNAPASGAYTITYR